MSAAPELIRKLSREGVRLEARGDRLHVEAPRGAITPNLRALLENRKDDLLHALSETGTRARLLAAAAAEYADADLIWRLEQGDVDACDGLPDIALRAFVRALEDDATRRAGRVPAHESEASICIRCGPVWVSPEVASVAPKISGIPHVLSCPWCHLGKTLRAAGLTIPRPRIECGTCTHFLPDTANPSAAGGRCSLAPGDARRSHYSGQKHQCADWQPDQG